MGIVLDEYKNNRTVLVNELTEYSRLLEQMELTEDRFKVLQYKNDILRDNFQLVVVGEFSRGKSTFINALLGSRILPSSAKPTTTILNKIVYSKEPMIELHYRDERRKPERITEEKFNSLVAPPEPLRGNADSEKEYAESVREVKEIQYAEIGRDLSICENGVEIIDTPGTNDIDPLREEITNTIIPRSDAAILLLSAVKILSESELSLLRDRLLANDIQKIFIVVNFKDELRTPADEQKVMDFAYANLKGILHEPKIYMVSAKHALNARRKQNGEVLSGRRGRPIEVWDFEQTGFPELEEHLADFLQYERGSIKLMKPIKRALENIKDVKSEYLEFEKKILTSQVKGLKEKVEAFRPRVEEAKKNANESLKGLKKQLQFEEKALVQWYEAEQEKITQKALMAFDQNRHLAESEISQKVELAVAKSEKALFEKKKEKINQIAKDSIQSASEKISAEWASMDFELKNMPQTDSNYSLSTIVNQGAASNGVDDFFGSIYDELDDAWDSTQGFWGKATVGVGIAASLATHGIIKLFSWGWSQITGVDEKNRLRSNLLAHYNEVASRKSVTLKAEYRNMRKFTEEQYKEITNQHLAMVEKQLAQLIESTKLEGKEIAKRQQLLLGREEKLAKISQALEQLAAKVQQRSAGKVGV